MGLPCRPRESFAAPETLVITQMPQGIHTHTHKGNHGRLDSPENGY